MASLMNIFAVTVVVLVIAILALHALAAVLPRNQSHYASFSARLLTSFALLVVCASYGVVASLALRLSGFGGLSQWTVARSFKWTMGLGTGVWFKIVRGENLLREDMGQGKGKVARVLVGNHQTELDVLFLGNIFPKYCSVTAKKSLKYWPFLGWFSMCSVWSEENFCCTCRNFALTSFSVALSKTVFIDRSNRNSAVSTFNTAAHTMKSEKQSVFIFPEGTRSYASSPTLLPFKKGAFHLAVQAQVPILPIVCANYANVLSIKRKVFNSGTILVSVLDPVSTEGLEAKDVDVLAKRIRDSMLAELERLSRISGTSAYGNKKGENGEVGKQDSKAVKVTGTEL
jgi:lysophosphatidate acyltransferase